MKYIGILISAIIAFSLKTLSRIFYRTKAEWITPKDKIDWPNLRVAVVLNHTSLFEPLYISAIPNYRIWRAIKRVVVPIADITMERPIVGFLFKLMVPNAVAITRRRDETWDRYLETASDPNSLLLIFPEGRMKRKDGLDKKGRPMSIKPGVADIIWKIESGKMMVAYSGGLHHVQAPGDLLPKLFKEIEIAFEEIDIPNYKEQMGAKDLDEFRTMVVNDLEGRLAKCSN